MSDGRRSGRRRAGRDGDASSGAGPSACTDTRPLDTALCYVAPSTGRAHCQRSPHSPGSPPRAAATACTARRDVPAPPPRGQLAPGPVRSRSLRRPLAIVSPASRRSSRSDRTNGSRRAPLSCCVLVVRHSTAKVGFLSNRRSNSAPEAEPAWQACRSPAARASSEWLSPAWKCRPSRASCSTGAATVIAGQPWWSLSGSRTAAPM